MVDIQHDNGYRCLGTAGPPPFHCQNLLQAAMIRDIAQAANVVKNTPY